MDLTTRLLHIILVYLAGISSIFAPIGLICSYHCLKRTHSNLKILILILGIIWCIQAFSCFLFILIIDSTEEMPMLYQKFEYQIAKFPASMCCYGFRLIETSIALERFVATVFFQTYEKKSIFRVIPFIAASISTFLGCCFSFLFNILRVPTYVTFTFLVTIETINFILLRRLQKQNQLLRKLSNSTSRSLLTSKYQIIENIRSLDCLFPQATISFIFSTIAILSSIIIGSIYEPYRNPIFLSLYLINITTLSTYWIYRSKCIKFIFASVSNRICHSSDVTTLKSTTTVKTALGQNIKANQTIDEHFNDMKNVWG